MKEPRMKKLYRQPLAKGIGLGIATLGLTALLAQGALAQFFGGAMDYRRTLFAPFGQEMLHFEAPLGMCFLDATDPTEAGALNLLREELKEHSKQTLVAAFADCMQIAAIGKGSTENDLGDIGLVTWLNDKGEKAPLDAQSYLDLREATMPNFTRAGLAGYLRPVLDDKVRRDENGVSLAFTAETEISYQTFKTVGITSAALIRGFPVDFMITHTAKKPQRDKEELYKLMDKFLAQQAALNAVQ